MEIGIPAENMHFWACSHPVLDYNVHLIYKWPPFACTGKPRYGGTRLRIPALNPSLPNYARIS